jgi:WD40 repeat protein
MMHFANTVLLVCILGLWIDNDLPAAKNRMSIHVGGKLEMLALSPDGNLLATVNMDVRTVANGRKEQFHQVRVYDLRQGKERFSAARTKFILGLTFSPHGNLLAACGVSTSEHAAKSLGAVWLWDTSTGQLVRQIEGHEATMDAVAFSPDGKYLATSGPVGTAGEVRIWEIETSKEIGSWKGHPKFVSHLAFSPDGQMVASGGQDGAVVIWHVATRQVLRALTGHTDELRLLAWSPDSKTLLSLDRNLKIVRWNVASGDGSPIDFHLRVPAGHTMCAAFAQDGSRVVVEDGINLYLLDSGTRRATHWFKTGHQKSVCCMAFSGDGKKLATGSIDETVQIWEVGGAQGGKSD